MKDIAPTQNSLVLYKSRPARVKNATRDRLEIETEGGRLRKVRPKDVVPIHPGPVAKVTDLEAPTPVEDLPTVWELLRDEEATDLQEVSELLFDAFSPAASWAAWQLVADGLYFRGSPDQLVPRTESEVTEETDLRRERERESERWASFVEQLRSGAARLAEDDDRYLRNLEELAHGKSVRSRVLDELGRGQSPEHAHALLLELGRWSDSHVPYARRLDVTLSPPPDAPVQLPDDGERLDLTHLPAFAIDDEGSRDPDDALSLDQGRVWVHVADVAAVVPADSAVDLEARARGANVYLPDGAVAMLPESHTRQLGLGLAERSPALSYGFGLSSEGELDGAVEIALTWIAAQRLTYAEAQEQIHLSAQLSELKRLMDLARRRRQRHGAVFIDWPEVKVRVDTSVDPPRISVFPIPSLESRDLVSEAMILAGEAAAAYALQHAIPLPFATQPPPRDVDDAAEDGLSGLAAMHALRQRMAPSRVQGSSAPHSALALEAYTRATSPLRRYQDLLVHQQLRSSLTGGDIRDAAEIVERASAAQAVTGSVRQLQRQASRHWTLVFLKQRPDWKGNGVVIDRRRRRSLVVIPELGLEIDMHVDEDAALGSEIPLALGSVDLPRLDAHFRMR